MLVQHLMTTPHYQKLKTSEELGLAVLLKNVEREHWKLWRLKPYDMTKKELDAQASVRERNRRTAKRRKQGVLPRSEYLAELTSKPKPWVVAGMSRSRWYRVRRGSSETILSKGQPQGV